MIGIDQDGIKIEKMRAVTRWSRSPLSVSEMVATSAKADRDSAIWTLRMAHGDAWSPRRLSLAFGISIQRVYQILQDGDEVLRELRGA